MDISHFSFIHLGPASSRASTPLDSFKTIVHYLVKNTDLLGVESIVTVPSDAQMKPAVQMNSPSLPKEYQDGYSLPLLQNFETMKTQLSGQSALVETVCGAVYQRSATYNATIKSALNRFQVVIQTLYEGFLQAEERVNLDLPLIEKVSPMAMFQKNGQSGPFTITAETMTRLFSGNIAVVSLPGILVCSFNYSTNLISPCNFLLR